MTTAILSVFVFAVAFFYQERRVRAFKKVHEKLLLAASRQQKLLSAATPEDPFMKEAAREVEELLNPELKFKRLGKEPCGHEKQIDGGACQICLFKRRNPLRKLEKWLVER